MLVVEGRMGIEMAVGIYKFDESVLRRNRHLRSLSGQIGNRIASGADGSVYSLEGGERSNQVIKIGKGTSRDWKCIFPILQKIQRKSSPFVVTVDSWGKIDHSAYYVVMERLSVLTANESRAAWLYYWYGENSFLKEGCIMKKGSILHKRARELRDGMRSLKLIGLRYGDFHTGNVMKDNTGRFKLVDPEAFTY